MISSCYFQKIFTEKNWLLDVWGKIVTKATVEDGCIRAASVDSGTQKARLFLLHTHTDCENVFDIFEDSRENLLKNLGSRNYSKSDLLHMWCVYRSCVCICLPLIARHPI